MLHPKVQVSAMGLAGILEGHFIMAGLFGGQFDLGRIFDPQSRRSGWRSNPTHRSGKGLVTLR